MTKLWIWKSAWAHSNEISSICLRSRRRVLCISGFDPVEPKFDEVLIEGNIRAGKYQPGTADAPTPINWIFNSGEYTEGRQCSGF